MRHFTTKSSPIGQYDLLREMINEKLIKISTHSNYTLSESWFISLHTSNACINLFIKLVTSSSWQDVGAIQVEKEYFKKPQEFDRADYLINDFFIKDVALYPCALDHALLVNGIKIESKSNDFIIISSGLSPGSMSIKSNIMETNFTPEFDFHELSSTEIILKQPQEN